jgi:hypothetical protein
MNSHFSLIPLLFAGALSLSGCGAPETSRQPSELFFPPEGAVEPEDWYVSMATGVCANLDSCQNYEMEGGEYDGIPCLEVAEVNLRAQHDVEQGLLSGGIVWDADEAGECIRQVASGICLPSLHSFDARTCLREFATVERGGVCGAHLECKGDDWCDIGVDGSGICRAVLAESTECYLNAACGPNGFCEDVSERSNDDGSIVIIPGFCVHYLSPGDECNEGDDYYCPAGYFCDIYEGYDHTGSCERK